LGLFLHWEKKGDRKIGNREIDVKWKLVVWASRAWWR
jgi:hypothetical protein